MTGPVRTYQLHIELSRRAHIEIGRLGRHTLAAGRYVYTGSARRGMEARIRRHLSRDKKPHWHIDYLLLHPAARVIEVRRFRAGECEVNRRGTGMVPVPGFGASDCRAGCGSHLRFLGGL
ncbi:MAG: GIY-YIG nuclease family protein [Acidiferrobacteraceae bacterium]|jgi:Uri superfamily endonuclease